MCQRDHTDTAAGVSSQVNLTLYFRPIPDEIIYLPPRQDEQRRYVILVRGFEVLIRIVFRASCSSATAASLYHLASMLKNKFKLDFYLPVFAFFSVALLAPPRPHIRQNMALSQRKRRKLLCKFKWHQIVKFNYRAVRRVVYDFKMVFLKSLSRYNSYPLLRYQANWRDVQRRLWLWKIF